MSIRFQQNPAGLYVDIVGKECYHGCSCPMDAEGEGVHRVSFNFIIPWDVLEDAVRTKFQALGTPQAWGYDGHHNMINMEPLKATLGLNPISPPDEESPGGAYFGYLPNDGGA